MLPCLTFRALPVTGKDGLRKARRNAIEFGQHETTIIDPMLGSDMVVPLLATKLLDDSPCPANGFRTDMHWSFDDKVCHGLPDKSVEDVES